MNNYYTTRQRKLRDEAIFWQIEDFTSIKSYEELAEAHEYFEKMGRRYGLLKEFRENGII